MKERNGKMRIKKKNKHERELLNEKMRGQDGTVERNKWREEVTNKWTKYLNRRKCEDRKMGYELMKKAL